MDPFEGVDFRSFPASPMSKGFKWAIRSQKSEVTHPTLIDSGGKGTSPIEGSMFFWAHADHSKVECAAMAQERGAAFGMRMRTGCRPGFGLPQRNTEFKSFCMFKSCLSYELHDSESE